MNYDEVVKAWTAYYGERSIPNSRRPNLIHVAGRYFMGRALGGDDVEGRILEKDALFAIHDAKDNPDAQAIAATISAIQRRTMLASLILYDYHFLINATAPATKNAEQKAAPHEITRSNV